MVVRFSALCEGHTLLPGRFLVLISDRGHNVAGRITAIEETSDLIGNRTRDLPACSIVPEPTTLPRDSLLGTPISVMSSYACLFYGASCMITS
jgi:hypothetical protein